MGIVKKVKRLSDYFQRPAALECCKDTLAMEFLSPLSKGYLPWTGSSIRPSALVTILNDIVINRRNCMVECGGGISTLYMARLLSTQGGHLYTIDHDERWAGLLSNMLQEEGLGSVVTVIHAPMEPNEYALEGNKWYSATQIEKELTDKRIDLLLVDGPLACEPEIGLARYPAVPYFKSRLSADCTVILDDIHRKGEREIVQRWSRDLGIPFQMRMLDGGIAIGCRKVSFNV